MTAVRRVWCPQDAQDAWLAARAVHHKGFPPGHALRVIESALADLERMYPLPPAPPMPVSTVPGRTRGRHRANRFSLRLSDLAPKQAAGES